MTGFYGLSICLRLDYLCTGSVISVHAVKSSKHRKSNCLFVYFHNKIEKSKKEQEVRIYERTKVERERERGVNNKKREEVMKIK